MKKVVTRPRSIAQQTHGQQADAVSSNAGLLPVRKAPVSSLYLLRQWLGGHSQNLPQSSASSPTVVVVLLNAFTEGISGSDAWFVEVARRWPQANLVVVTSSLGKQLCLQYGITAQFIVTTKEKHFDNIIKTYLARTIRATKLIRQIQQVAIIHSTSDAPPDVIPALWLRKQHPESIWVQRICHTVPGKRGRLVAWATQVAMHTAIRRHADRVLVISHVLASQLVRRRFLPEYLTVTHPGITIRSSREKAAEGKQSTSLAETYDGLFVGRLHASKGIWYLPSIWAAVSEQLPGTRLAVAGHGDEKHLLELSRAFRSKGVENVVDLLGYVSPGRLNELYHTSKLFVFPSQEEGYGMALADAIAYGLTAVAWDLPTYEEHFGYSVIQVPRGDIRQFAMAIVDGLSGERNSTDKASTTGILVHQSSWEQVAEKEWKLITETSPRTNKMGKSHGNNW